MRTEDVMKMQQELAVEQEGKAHYIPVEATFPFFCHYAYLDTEEYLADGLFVQARVRVHFGKEFVHPDSEYRLIFLQSPQERQRDISCGASKAACENAAVWA